MTIKKPINTTGATEVPAAPAAASGATIADRFKLDLADPNEKKAPAGKGTMIAVIVGLIALAVVGVLTFVIYQHWDFLQSA